MTSPTIVLGAPDGDPSILPLITTALADIKAARDIIANHTHPTIGPCDQSASISVKSSAQTS